MTKVFPHIRIVGETSEDVALARSYVRRGMMEHHKTLEIGNHMGAPVYGRTTTLLDGSVIIYTSINNGVETIRITATAPSVPLTTTQREQVTLDSDGCPPAFVIYARKRLGPLLGSEDKDYLIAYNEGARSWYITTVDPYLGCSNTGYWGLDKGIGPHASCDVVTWDGQPGGFCAMGYAAMGYVNTGFSYGATATDDHANDGFYIGGYRIQTYGSLLAAGIFKKKNGDYKYYTLKRQSTYLEIHEGTMPEPDANGLIEPDWTKTHSFDYVDYADSVVAGGYDRWGPPSGNAFLNEDGVAYIGIPIEKDVAVSTLGGGPAGGHIWVMHLLAIDLLNGTLKIVRDNLDSMPNNSHWSTKTEAGQTHAWQYFADEYYVFGACSSGSVPGTPPAPAPPGNKTIDSGGEASYSNKNRPTLLRTFGGLDRLYTYEFEVDWSTSVSYSYFKGGYTQSTGRATYTNCIPPDTQLSHTFYWASGYSTAARNEIERGEATIYVYDYGSGEESKKEVDSLKVLEIKNNVAATQRQSLISNASTNDVDAVGNLTVRPLEVDDPDWIIDSPTPRSSTPWPSGVGTQHHIYRHVIDHHPQIKGSWSYIETEDVYDIVKGTTREKIIRIVHMGEVVDTFHSTIGAAGHIGFPSYDHSVTGVSGYPLNERAVPRTTWGHISELGGTNPDVFEAHLEANSNFDGSDFSSIPAQDYGLLDQPCYDAFERESSLILQPEPMRIPNSQYGTCMMTQINPYVQMEFAIPQALYGAGEWGHPIDHTFPTGGNTAMNPNSVAVHRPIGRNAEYPYIWAQKKVNYETIPDPNVGPAPGRHKTHLWQNGQVPALIVSSPLAPVAYEGVNGAGTFASEVSHAGSGLASNITFWTKDQLGTSVSEIEEWKTIADSGEWRISSNVLTEDMILQLTKEESIDIIGIGII